MSPRPTRTADPVDAHQLDVAIDDQADQVDQLDDQAERDAKAIANVPEALHDQARAEGWAEGQQGPFA